MEPKRIQTKIIKFSIKKGKITSNTKLYNKMLCDLKKQYKINPNLIIEQAVIGLLPKILEKSYSNKRKLKNKKSAKFDFFIIPEKEKQLGKAIRGLFVNLKINNERRNEIFNTSLKKGSKTLLLKEESYKSLEKLKFT